MQGASQLDQLIQQVRSEGTLDSSGTFGVNWEHALQKMSGLVHECPARWVYYLAQAAVASSATGLNVSCGRKGISVEFTLATRACDLARLQNILTGCLGPKTPTGFLNSALLWAWALKPPGLEFVYQDAEGGYLYCLEAKGGGQRELSADEKPRVALFYRFRPYKKKKDDDEELAPEDRALTAEVSRYLSEFLCYCPLPVSLDNRPITRREPFDRYTTFIPRGFHIYRRLVLGEPDAKGVLAAQPAARWPAARVHVEGLPPFSNPSRVHSLGLLEVVGGRSYREVQAAPQAGEHELELVRWELENDEGLSARRLVLDLDYNPRAFPGLDLVRCRALFYRLREPLGRLLLVHHGLLLKPVPLPELAADGWDVVIASHNLETDYSGLKVVEDERYQRLVSWAQETVAHIYRRLAPRPVIS